MNHFDETWLVIACLVNTYFSSFIKKKKYLQMVVTKEKTKLQIRNLNQNFKNQPFNQYKPTILVFKNKVRGFLIVV